MEKTVGMSKERKNEIISQSKQKITLKMIAELAGVSTSCVTRCVNNSGYVSQKKRDKINAVMKDLNYIPNQSAKCLRGGQSKLLGYIYLASDINIVFTKLGVKIERTSYEKGYSIISVAMPVVTEEILSKAVGTLMTYGVDGIILYLGSGEESLIAIKKVVKQCTVPVVVVERSVAIFEGDMILIDNVVGGYIAVNKLLEAGHRRIAYLGVEEKDLVEKQRYSGYLQAMEMFNPEYAKTHSYFVGEYTLESGYRKCREMLEGFNEDEMPTAIFAASDILAAGIYRAFHEMKIRIPEQISIVGYDDTIAEFMSPPLSTMELPLGEIAEAAIETLMEKIENSESNSNKKTILIGPKFIQRESIKRLE